MKRCSQCEIEKPFSDFYRRKRNRDGFAGTCRDCSRAYTKQWRADNPERVANYKTSISPEKWREYQARYNASDKARAKSRRYRERNPLTAEQRAVRDEKNREYRRRNREMVRRWSRNGNQRRASARQEWREAMADIKPWLDILERDPCCYCGAPMGEFDHIVPVASEGEADWMNLTAACAHCNRSKGAKPLLTFLLAAA